MPFSPTTLAHLRSAVTHLVRTEGPLSARMKAINSRWLVRIDPASVDPELIDDLALVRRAIAANHSQRELQDAADRLVTILIRYSARRAL